MSVGTKRSRCALKLWAVEIVGTKRSRIGFVSLVKSEADRWRDRFNELVAPDRAAVVHPISSAIRAAKPMSRAV